MNAFRRQTEVKTRIFNNGHKIDTLDYLKYVDHIRKRRNQYSISPKKKHIRKLLYEPFKDPNVIKENRKYKLKIYNILDEPALPKLNNIYLEIREKLKINKEKLREIAERALSFENTKYMDRVFNQKSLIEEQYKCKKIPKLKLSKTFCL